MNDNLRKKALLSINPSFNCQFLENNVFSQQLSVCHPLIKRNSQKNPCQIVEYVCQKSEPAALQGAKRYERYSESLAIQKPKSKSVVYMKLKSAQPYKRNYKFDQQIAIDSKKEGKAYRIRNYGKWPLN